MKTSPYLRALIAFAVLLVSAPADSLARDYVRKDLYPAQVRSFTFAAGTVFDADHPYQVRYWSVSFGPALPRAIFHAINPLQVEILDLLCTDKGLGTHECGLSLSDESCFLFVDVPPDTFADGGEDMPEDFLIGCPAAIELTG